MLLEQARNQCMPAISFTAESERPNMTSITRLLGLYLISSFLTSSTPSLLSYFCTSFFVLFNHFRSLARGRRLSPSVHYFWCDCIVHPILCPVILYNFVTRCWQPRPPSPCFDPISYHLKRIWLPSLLPAFWPHLRYLRHQRFGDYHANPQLSSNEPTPLSVLARSRTICTPSWEATALTSP